MQVTSYKPQAASHLRQYRFKQFCFILGIVGLSLVCFIQGGGRLYGKEKEVEIIKVETKEITGEVVSFSPMKNPKFIGVAYQVGDVGYDAFFKVDENVKIVHKRSLDEIKLGDMVSVTYNEITQKTEGGREQTVRVAKTIRFIKPATREIRPELKKSKASENLKTDFEIKGYKSVE
ncbi:MAG TPA: hypothetical protein ENG49_03215 [Candidatus Omnitrophica bacterium]|nr:hypothetical protein [Candidatus Omnitrophota bacterium]